MLSVDRRAFLAGVAVVASDPLGHRWLGAAARRDGGGLPGSLPVPGLDGELLTDPASLAGAAEDLGHIVHRTPVAGAAAGAAGDL